LADMAAAHKPRALSAKKRSLVSGVEAVDLDEVRPVIVGERTNVIGSRAFKRLVVEGKWDEAAEIGRKQVRGGAHVVDVCLANPDRDEKTDVIAFLEHLTKKVKAPLMIDSTDAEVMEEALKRSQGKAIVNSINLEDGLDRFERVVPLIKRFGADVVVGCIDEDPVQGMAVTRARKVEIAGRSLRILTEDYGLPAEDIIFDALVFPVGTGDAQYIGSALETIEGVRAIKGAYPACKTILGISNVSFGLPDAGREVLNTVFLHRCFEAGLDMAIVNAEKLERVTHLPPNEVALANALIEATPPNYKSALDAFSAYFKGKAGAAPVASKRASLPLHERLALSVVEGSREGLVEDLDEAVQTMAPLDIINGPLMKGMSEVGRLFGANQLIVAEVLQSAEVMKAAVAHLEPLMKASGDVQKRARMILATVKGDVHDIGKNLVDIILSNNGYDVVNLGIKVPPAKLIEAVREHKPDFIGLSGLLVKSAQEMVATADELRASGISLPIFVGGAALSERFTYGRIASSYGDGVVAYASSAMAGLDLANRLFDDERRAGLLAQVDEKKRAAAAAKASASNTDAPLPEGPARVIIKHDEVPPKPPDLDEHVLSALPLEEIWRFINPMMLYA
ncbi:MAG TPA: dihydropteroate synthase, partial [Myxococcota bacterium]